MSGGLEFIDTGDMTTMNVMDHNGVTDVEWDPTGRYITTAVSYWSQKVPDSITQHNTPETTHFPYTCIYMCY